MEPISIFLENTGFLQNYLNEKYICFAVPSTIIGLEFNIILIHYTKILVK
jgi:hypothetical protein